MASVGQEAIQMRSHGDRLSCYNANVCACVAHLGCCCLNCKKVCVQIKRHFNTQKKNSVKSNNASLVINTFASMTSDNDER